jgi:hypothetical protein
MATTVSPRIAHWTDKRAKHKSRASARLETIKRQTVWRAAHLSAAAARASGSPRYVGHPCKRGHRGERFTFGGGGCVECARLGAERRRRQRGATYQGPRVASRHPLKSVKRHSARIARMS